MDFPFQVVASSNSSGGVGAGSSCGVWPQEQNADMSGAQSCYAGDGLVVPATGGSLDGGGGEDWYSSPGDQAFDNSWYSVPGGGAELYNTAGAVVDGQWCGDSGDDAVDDDGNVGISGSPVPIVGGQDDVHVGGSAALVASTAASP